MKRKIHIMGASGAGTSTLGAALAEKLPHTYLDTDDYFWTKKFTEQRAVPDRRELLQNDLLLYENWILSGAVCGWGDDFKNYFDLLIFLWIPKDIRLERLKERESQRYGKGVLPGGSNYEQSKTFLEWASLYDDAGLEVRSKTLHEQWMKDAPCPVLRIEGDYTVAERVNLVLNYLNSN
ncbi:AAA family ATPase [Saliterribacillus persicus]|uniref:Adenylate kinase family enzyme n=1 Tax=Saliterribacillus persicus TaxID=930114 RepID=A0A368YAT0_9BACI|nr:AAA family ATPase [Saliterribacillus persicus]RCW77312.1 adenylate kinase family enzyme [Saliterribacillus persicus]